MRIRLNRAVAELKLFELMYFLCCIDFLGVLGAPASRLMAHIFLFLALNRGAADYG
jgi:hypothetical protein